MNIFHRLQELRADASEPENMRMLLTVYWRILLGFVFVVMIGVFVYGGSLILTVMNGSPNIQSVSNSSSKKSSSTAINSTQVDAVLQGFAARQARFEAHKASTTPVTDPSL